MKKSEAIICALLLVVIVGCVAATYIMTSPSSPDVTVNPSPTPTPQQATLSAVTASPLILTVGDTLTLSTTVSDATAGLTVTFYNQNNVAVGQAATNIQGTATLQIQPPEGTWSFYATATHP